MVLFWGMCAWGAAGINFAPGAATRRPEIQSPPSGSQVHCKRIASGGKGWHAKQARVVAMHASDSAAEELRVTNGGGGLRIAVVGTGMAAIMCTRTLARMARGEEKSGSAVRNARITICTSRGKLATQMGPRNQTIPRPGNPFFDYGCQYFTATDAVFRREVERWQALGFMSAFSDGEVGAISPDGFAATNGEKCWVGNGGMGPMLTRIIEDTATEFEGTVEHISGFPNSSMAVKQLAKATDGWHLTTKGGGKLGPFDFVIGGFAQHVLTDPFLLSGGEGCERMLQCLRRVESNQLIPIQVSFEGGSLPANFTAAHVYGEDCLSFVSNNSKRPQHSGKWGTPGPEHWTLISTAAFAEREFNTNPKRYRASAQRQMFDAFARILGIASLSQYRPSINRINHWEDGLPTNTPPNSRGCLFDAEVGLGWCGDFCVAPGIEGAARSGQSMATTLSNFCEQSKEFDPRGFLPCDEAWTPFQPDGCTLVDIGSFPAHLGLSENWTHTQLVPSAIGGYNLKAHVGAAGQKTAFSQNRSTGGHKGKGRLKRRQLPQGTGSSSRQGK